MSLISLTDCCRLLTIDPKTLRRWLNLAHVPLQPHPLDARIKGISAEQLQQVATAHHRRLADFPKAAPPPVPLSLPEVPPLPSGEIIDVLQTISELSAQIMALQQRLTELTPLLPIPVLASPAQEESATIMAEPVAVAATPTTSASAKRLTAPTHVLPLVEYATQGGYVIICPEHGLLTFEPDSTDWFTWLATRSSFRFVGKHGRLTAHREVHRLPRAVWRAHRQIRNHTYNIRLGSTQSLTIAALEQAAADLQAHLA